MHGYRRIAHRTSARAASFTISKLCVASAFFSGFGRNVPEKQGKAHQRQPVLPSRHIDCRTFRLQQGRRQRPTLRPALGKLRAARVCALPGLQPVGSLADLPTPCRGRRERPRPGSITAVMSRGPPLRTVVVGFRRRRSSALRAPLFANLQADVVDSFVHTKGVGVQGRSGRVGLHAAQVARGPGRGAVYLTEKGDAAFSKRGLGEPVIPSGIGDNVGHQEDPRVTRRLQLRELLP